MDIMAEFTWRFGYFRGEHASWWRLVTLQATMGVVVLFLKGLSWGVQLQEERPSLQGSRFGRVRNCLLQGACLLGSAESPGQEIGLPDVLSSWEYRASFLPSPGGPPDLSR